MMRSSLRVMMISLSSCSLMRTTTAFLQPRARQSSRLFSSTTDYLDLAVQHARNGLGNTFPNPAVGCVIVQQDGDDEPTIVGAGFHPRAGMPHAEVFALLQAAGHLEDGVAAAQAIVDNNNQDLIQRVQELTDQYKSESIGPSQLFGGTFHDETSTTTTTAYVTLEPCCHHGLTPPCAVSLVEAGVDKVVVGFRDPNPRVDGGGYQVMQEAGIEIVEATTAECANLVPNFVKRITPRDDSITDYATIMTGAKRRSLRSLAGRKKTDQTLAQINWAGSSVPKDDDDLEESVSQLLLQPSWMEHADGMLWDHELLLLRLNTAVAKKKGAKILGERIAEQLNAHVAQVVGHTALLYRPSIPAVLNLDSMMAATVGDAREKD